MSSGDAALLTLTGVGVLYYAIGFGMLRARLGGWYRMRLSGRYDDDRVLRDASHYAGRAFEIFGARYALATLVLIPLPDTFALTLALVVLLAGTLALAALGWRHLRRRVAHYRAIDEALAPR
jgi:uncharacterized membrane protein